MTLSRFSFLVLALLALASVRADEVRYFDSPASYPDVTNELSAEFGANPISESSQTVYQVQGTGAVDLNFRFKGDTGGYSFSFGFYRITASLNAIDVSTDAGKMQYAQQALSSATLVFDDLTDDPGASATISAMGGDVLGFFLIPNNTLANYLADPSAFAPDGTAGNPAPLFSVSGVNPGDFDQLLSFSGLSGVTGKATNLFAWEDLSRYTGSDENFDDLVFTVEGVTSAPPTAAPAPAALASFAVGGLGVLRRRRR